MIPYIQLVPSTATNVHGLRHRCGSCSVVQLCQPTDSEDTEMFRLEQIVGRRRVVREGTLYRMNDVFSNLYAIRVGHFKTYQVNAGGSHQITGFQMAGEWLAMDGIGSGRHQCNAVALEDSEVCEIPFAKLEKLLAETPSLLRHLHRTMSKEIAREEHAMLMLGNMRAEQRLAAFLTDLSARYATRGYSSNTFQLRMTREEIGNYLGLTIESVSRLLSKFKKQGWVDLDNRQVVLLDHASLRAMATGMEPEQGGAKFMPWN